MKAQKAKRGSGKVCIQWSPRFAYAVGLMVTDGCLYNDERHLSFTTKDVEQAENFKKCFGISVKTGLKSRGGSQEKKYYHVQFGDVAFYKFLLDIGLSAAKSKTIGAIEIPDAFFFDYLRGCFDGDGCFYSYWDPRWRSSHLFYVEFASASGKHIDWLRETLEKKLGVRGHIGRSDKTAVLNLKYAKKEALEIIRKMYYSPSVVCLSRKREKIQKAIAIERKQQKSYQK